MANSVVGIVNLALVRGKAGKNKIANIDENSVAAQTAKAVWDYVRDEVLAAFPWNFAKRRAELSQSTTTPPNGYDYQYAKPASCLKILEVVTESDAHIAFVEEGDYLLTDTDNTNESLYILYTTVVTDVSKWTPPFITAFAYKLAADLGTDLKSIDQNDMLNKYQLALLEAVAFNQGQEYIEDDTGSDDWVTAGR